MHPPEEVDSDANPSAAAEPRLGVGEASQAIESLSNLLEAKSFSAIDRWQGATLLPLHPHLGERPYHEYSLQPDTRWWSSSAQSVAARQLHPRAHNACGPFLQRVSQELALSGHDDSLR
jgi:hypothetical protein